MSKKSVLPITLALSLGAMGGWIYFVELEKDDVAEDGAEVKERIFTLNSEAVQSFTVRNQNGTFSFERAGDGWRLSAPIEATAEPNIVMAILTSIEGARSERVLTEASGRLSTFELDDPGASITLTGAQGEEEILHIGAAGPFGGQYYARKEGSTNVLLTVDPLQSYLGGTLFEYRFKGLAEFNLVDVTALNLEGARIPPVSIKRQGKDFVAASPDASFRLDRNEVEDILMELKGLEAMDFTTEEPPKEGDPPPLLKVSLSLKDNPEPSVIVFREARVQEAEADTPTPTLGAEGPMVVAWVEDSQEGRVIPEAALAPFQVTLDLLRDRAPISFQRWLVDRVDITAGERSFVATKEGFEWSVEPADGGLEAREVGAFLDTLAKGEARRFIEDYDDLSEFGLDAPAITITVTHSKEGAASTLKLKQEGSALYAIAGGDPTIYDLEPDLFMSLVDLLEASEAPPAQE